MGGPPSLLLRQPLVCSISCQHIISRSPNRGQIECLNIPPQAVADPLKMACSMLPGVGDVCVCQDQVLNCSFNEKQPAVSDSNSCHPVDLTFFYSGSLQWQRPNCRLFTACNASSPCGCPDFCLEIFPDITSLSTDVNSQ